MVFMTYLIGGTTGDEVKTWLNRTQQMLLDFSWPRL